MQLRRIVCTALAALALAGCQEEAPAAAPPATPAAQASAAPSPTSPATPSPAPSPTSPPTPQPTSTPRPPTTLDKIRARGSLVCGISEQRRGVSAPDGEGSFAGVAVDYCRAVAAAVLGDAGAVTFTEASGQRAAAGLLGGTIDMLAAVEPLSDTSQAGAALRFGPPVFYDGAGLMTRAALGVETLKGLSGGSVCVERDSPEEQLLAEQFLARGLRLTTVVYERREDALVAYDAGLCDALAGRKTDLAAEALLTTYPAEHVVLDLSLRDEPLAPAVSAADIEWAAVVEAVVRGTFQAEAIGVGSQDIGAQLDSDDGPVLDLPRDFIAQAVRAVGNHGEIYARHFGPESASPIPPGPNAIAAEGGLIGR